MQFLIVNCLTRCNLNVFSDGWLIVRAGDTLFYMLDACCWTRLVGWLLVGWQGFAVWF